jgi:peptide/nickel transport system permease protein
LTGYQKYFLRKFAWYGLTFIMALSLNFFLPRMIKGNPVEMISASITSGMTDNDSIKKVYETFSKEFGLDKSKPEQFIVYLKKIAVGDLGTSFGMYPRKVNSIIGSAIPWTIGLQLPAILIGWILGNLLGAIAAYKKGVFDKVMMTGALMVSAIPTFVFSIILVTIFAVNLKWFPSHGGYGFDLFPSWNPAFIWSVIRHHQLPLLSITLVMIGVQAIGMRSMSIYELNADYVLYAKLVGIRDGRIVKYVFRNAMLPQITGLASSLGTMVGGALICEIIFSYPGVGTSLFTAIRTLDYPLISGCTLIITIGVLGANFLLEIIYGLVDPRIKAAQLEDL